MGDNHQGQTFRPDTAVATTIHTTAPDERVVEAASAPTPARPLQEMLVSLEGYLPQALYEPLERRPTERALDRVRDHLIALLRTTKTYLPRPVVLAPQPAGEPAGDLCRGSFLFVDVSGFTPLSEKLSHLGQEGAERMTGIINDLFYNLVSVLFDHGGTLLKFGGDALLGLFAADADPALPESALRAVQAAGAMQTLMEKFAAIPVMGQTHTLRIKCGVSSGPYFAAHVGTRLSMAYVTTGHTVNRADQAEGHANPGEVVVARVTRDLLGECIEAEPRNGGFFLVHRMPPVTGSHRPVSLDEPPPGDQQTQIADLVGRMNRLSPYVPVELLSRIVTNPSEARISPDHRPVTVLFANYVGVSDLVKDLGEARPDLITRHLNDYFVHMAELVERYEGTVGRMDQYAIGDRLVIFFGAPRAHEDDPVRAVHTALEMQEATRQHFAALQMPGGIYRFRQRIGINTGHLFAGNVGAPDLRQEYTLMGDDINVAARLMSKASWQDILVGQKTHKRVQAFFDLEDRGALKVKGKEISVPAFRVLGRREKIGRTRGLATGESPLIGRGDELLTLEARGRELLGGRGGIVSIIGGSGLGKSRLMRELRGWLFGKQGGEEVVWLEGHAFSFSERVSYALAVMVLRGALGLQHNVGEDDALFALWEQGEALLGKESAREAVPFLAYLMDLSLKGEWAAWVQELDPQVRQKQTFWAVREFFAAAARERPMVVALDDLHWADEASLALVEDLLKVTDHSPLMFCLIFRQRRDKGCWRLRDQAASLFPHRYTEVALKPLAEAYSRELLGKLLPGAEFSPTTLCSILEKSAGNPFYLEEVVRSLIDSEAVVADDSREGYWRVTSDIDRITVPDTLQGAIVARVDRLTEDARQALQMAAVIGRRFPLRVLQSLHQAEAELKSWLSKLERSGLIHAVEPASDLVYAFSDALVHEVAYESLLVQRRREFHRRVGEALEVIFAGQLDQECELLAYHFGCSDDHRRAIKYLEMAGHKAQSEFANATAIRYYSDLLTLLGDREEAWQKRFEVLARRQQVHSVLGQQQARQADLEEMLALAQAHKDDTCHSDALNALSDLYQWTGRYAEAEETALKALALKTELGDLAGQASSLHQRGVVNYYKGEYAQARASLEKAVSLRQEIGDSESEAWSLMYLGMIDFALGDYEHTAEHHNRALQAAQARQDWFQIGIHLTNAARVSVRLGEHGRALEQFQQSLEMKERIGDRIGKGFSLFGLGLVHIHLGDYDAAEEAFQSSLELRRRIDDERGVGYCLHGLGLVALGQEKYERAEAWFQRAYDTRLGLGLKAEMSVDLSYLGQAYLGLGRFDEAMVVSGQAIALLTEQESVEEVKQIYLNHFRVLATQRDAAAGGFLQKAHKIMVGQAARIKDLERRRIFLKEVEVNREISAEMERHSQGDLADSVHESAAPPMRVTTVGS